MKKQLKCIAISMLMSALAFSACGDDGGPADIEVVRVNLNKTSTIIEVGSTEQLTARITPANATNQSVTWSSSDETKVAVSSSGFVTAVTEGSAIITVSTAKDGFSEDRNLIVDNVFVVVTKVHRAKVSSAKVRRPKASSAKVRRPKASRAKVSRPKVRVRKISLNKSSILIGVGFNERLTVRITPANATNQNVTWSSNNKTKVTVSSSGFVSAIAEGSATITVSTTKGGFSADCTVLVDNFASADTPGDVAHVKAGSTRFNMIYANNSTNITLPTGTDDSGTATLKQKFFMGETEVTNELMTKVFQWAYDNGKFSKTADDHNGLGSSTVKWGTRQLVDLDDSDIKINYSRGSFTVDSGYKNYPVVCVTWYGAIMFCNWLTEMTDKNTDNVVYSGIETTWDHAKTVKNAAKKGYRLPLSDEWGFAARYRGNDSTNTVSGYRKPYYTKGNSASGAYTFYNDETDTSPANGVLDGREANDRVAVAVEVQQVELLVGILRDGSPLDDTAADAAVLTGEHAGHPGRSDIFQ